MSGISPLRVEGGQGRVYRDCPIKIREYEYLGDFKGLDLRWQGQRVTLACHPAHVGTDSGFTVGRGSNAHC